MSSLRAKAAKADSSEAAMQDTVEFGGDKFPLGHSCRMQPVNGRHPSA